MEPSGLLYALLRELVAARVAQREVSVAFRRRWKKRRGNSFLKRGEGSQTLVRGASVGVPVPRGQSRAGKSVSCLWEMRVGIPVPGRIPTGCTAGSVGIAEAFCAMRARSRPINRNEDLFTDHSRRK